MISTLAYLAGMLATLVVGVVIGVWFTRRHEAERFAELLELEDSLRESAGAVIRQQTIRGRLADAWLADAEQWQQVADTLDFPMTDYTGKDQP